MIDFAVEWADSEVGKADLVDFEIKAMVFFEFETDKLVELVVIIDWKNKKFEELFANNAMMDSFFHSFFWLRVLH